VTEGGVFAKICGGSEPSCDYETVTCPSGSECSVTCQYIIDPDDVWSTSSCSNLVIDATNAASFSMACDDWGCGRAIINCPNGGDCDLYSNEGGFQYANIRGGFQGTLNLEFNHDGGYQDLVLGHVECPEDGFCNIVFGSGTSTLLQWTTIDASKSKALSIVGVGSTKPLQEAVVLCPPKNDQGQARCSVRLSGADWGGAGLFYKAHFYLYEGLDDLTIECKPDDTDEAWRDCDAPTISCYTALDFHAQDECQLQIADGVFSCEDNRCEEPLPEGGCCAPAEWLTAGERMHDMCLGDGVDKAKCEKWRDSGCEWRAGEDADCALTTTSTTTTTADPDVTEAAVTIITCDAETPCVDTYVACPDTGGACEVHCEVGGQCSKQWGFTVDAYIATDFSLFCDDHVDGCERIYVRCPMYAKGADCNVFVDHHGSGRANMMKDLTLWGREHNAVRIEVNGAAYALGHSVINCPEHGSCNIVLGPDTSFALWQTMVYAEDSESLTIVGDGAASPWVGSGFVNCPESNDADEPMCHISLTGSVNGEHTLFEDLWLSTYAGIGDVELECDYTTSAEVDCGEPKLNCYYHSKNTRNTDSCLLYLAAGTDEWGCGSGQCGASTDWPAEKVLAGAESIVLAERAGGMRVSLVGVAMLAATASLVVGCVAWGKSGDYKTLG